MAFGLAVAAVRLAELRAPVVVPLAFALADRAVPLAFAFAVRAVPLAFAFAARAVLCPFARAARAVLVAPRLAVRAVRRAPAAADEVVARAVSAPRSTVSFALRTDSMVASVASLAAPRTALAVPRAVDDPLGAVRGFLRRRIVATRSPSAVTPPWATPVTVSPTRSTTPAAAPTTRLPGGVSGDRGCGWVGRRLRGGRHGVAEVVEGVAAELVADLGEELVFLLLDVVADVLDQDGDLGVEALVLRVHVVELGEHPLDDVVLLEALEGDVLGLRARSPGPPGRRAAPRWRRGSTAPR